MTQKKALAKKQEAAEIQEVQPVSDAVIMASLVEKLVLNPDVSIDKLERVIAIQDQKEAKQSETAFNAAMAKAQHEMSPVSANAVNTHTRSKYATFDQLDRSLRPIYTKHGFALSFDEGETDKADHLRCLCYVTHKAGHTRTYHKDVPIVTTGAKGNTLMTPTHANASADTYGMRYLLKKIFNVAIGEADDDGNAAGEASATINDKQEAELRDLIEANNLDMGQFLRMCKVSRLSEIHARAFNGAKDRIHKAIKQQEEKQ